MRPHPDFAARAVPDRAALVGFGLRALRLADLEEDLAAIAESSADLRGVFGDDWPEGLTREADALDLAWHEREFAARRSFAFVITGANGGYLGCAYVYPQIGARGSAEVYFWFRTSALAGDDPRPAFREALGDWLAGPDWPRVAYVFRS